MRRLSIIIFALFLITLAFAQSSGNRPAGGNEKMPSKDEKTGEQKKGPDESASQKTEQTRDTEKTKKEIKEFRGWFFIPGAYWTFQDGTVGFLYVQGKYPKFGWTFDGRYSFSGDYWLKGDLETKLIGFRNQLSIKYCMDSLETDYRKPNISHGDTFIAAPYTINEYSIYYRQHFNAGKVNKFRVHAGYLRGEYTSPFSYNGSWAREEEKRIADAVDMGAEFSYDTRDDPEDPKSAFYFGIRLGGLLFPSAEESDFDYLSDAQFGATDKKWPPKGTGYIELDQRLYGKLDTKKVPFPMILALRIGLGHHLNEVPQLVAFRAGEDDFLRGIDQRHILGKSYYLMSGELRMQVWQKSYTPLILLHWLIPGYENPRPILEIVPIIEAGKIYGEYVREKDQQVTYGLGLHWVFSDFTVLRFDVCNWAKGKKWGAYFSFDPGI